MLMTSSPPSIPRIWKGSSGRWRIARPGANTGSSQLASRPVPRMPKSGPSGGPGHDRKSPSTTEGIASSHSWIVITDGDSWIFGSTSGSRRLSPQNVSPMRRNM